MNSIDDITSSEYILNSLDKLTVVVLETEKPLPAYPNPK